MLRDELEEFNIFALREYARRTGVSSPTSKKKEVLIDEILDIVEGRKAPTISNKFGRPPKEFHADVFGVRTNFDSTTTFNQESQDFDYSTFKSNMITGYLEQNNNVFILNVFVDGKILTHFIPYEISNKYDLRIGDKVAATIVKRGNNFVIDEIVSVNEVALEKFNNLRPHYADLRHDVSSKVLLNYDKTIVHTADIIYLKGGSNIKNSLTLIDMLNRSNGAKNVYLNVSLIEKSIGLIDNLRCKDKFTALITDSKEYVSKLVRLCVEYARRLVESGEDVVLGVDDMLTIRSLDDGENLIRQILSLAKNSKEAGSLTLLAIMPELSLKEFDKLCDNTLLVE